jgi:hypothetical protein
LTASGEVRVSASASSSARVESSRASPPHRPARGGARPTLQTPHDPILRTPWVCSRNFPNPNPLSFTPAEEGAEAHRFAGVRPRRRLEHHERIRAPPRGVEHTGAAPLVEERSPLLLHCGQNLAMQLLACQQNPTQKGFVSKEWSLERATIVSREIGCRKSSGVGILSEISFKIRHFLTAKKKWVSSRVSTGPSPLSASTKRSTSTHAASSSST